MASDVADTPAPAAVGRPGQAGDPSAPPEEQESGAAGVDGEVVDVPEPEEALAEDAAVEGPEALAARAEKAAEYLALAQRTQADFENYRKRAAKEAAAAQARGVAKLAKELLPAVDDLDRALTAAESEAEDNPLVQGIKLVHADMVAALARVGIESYSPQGERFDPQHHEAVAQMPVEGAEPGTIVEVYQRGYVFGESIIRPARVVVAG